MESMISTNHMMMSKGLDYYYYSSSSSDDEESSWSFYLETQTETGSLISGSKTSSLDSLSATDPPQDRRIGAKRRKTDFSFVDHDLEDTATSPDHTPKMNKISIFQKSNLFQDLHKNQHDGSYGDASQAGGIDFRVEKRSHDDTTELRRTGLCLVPVSMHMFLDYYYVS